MRLTLALLLAAVPAAAAAPEPRELGSRTRTPDGDVRLPYESFQLPNGLTVIVHEDHSAPLVSVNAWYRVGSAREKPGRTGFAHLFEHLMFEGSEHVPEGAFDRWLEGLGGSNNGTTNTDRTEYWEDVPAAALEMPLYLESDRMGFLLGALRPDTVDGQRDVVKNERRQSYENRPYGMAYLTLADLTFPPEHPYHWPTIGSMEDLSAAGYDDVVDFFKRWYGPGNTTLVVAGDVDTPQVRTLVQKWFGDLPRTAPVPPLVAQPVVLAGETRAILEDRVQLPRLFLRWVTPPYLSPADPALAAAASILGDGKSSRLYKRLVYDTEMAQDVTAYQGPGALASTFDVVVTARAGHTLSELLAAIDLEIARLRETPPTAHELERFQNRSEAEVYSGLERVGGFSGKASLLNEYAFYADDPDYVAEDLARTRALSPDDVRAVAQRFLGAERVVLSVVPAGHPELAVPEVQK